MIANKDAATFPFLKGASEYAKVSINDIDFNLVDNYLFGVYEKKYPSYIEELDAGAAVQQLIGCCAVLSVLHKPRATVRFAGYEAAKYAMRLKYLFNLKKDWTAYLNLIVKTIYQNPPIIKKINNTTCYVSTVNDYLELVLDSIGKNDKFNMINQVCVVKGNVIYERDMLFDIIEERIKYFLIERINAMKLDFKTTKWHEGVTNKLRELANKYQYIDMYTQVYRYEQVPTSNYNIEELYAKVSKLKKGQTPPCVTKIINDFGARNISHFERFLVASFLLSKQMSMDEIIEIFSKDIKFKRDITQDQLIQLSRREYKPPSCSKINTNNCCHYSKEICGFIKNPIQLIGEE